VSAGSSLLRRNPASLAPAVRRYRVMAYVTGVVLVVLVFAGIPLQVFAHNDVIVNYVGTTHGILYIIYVCVAYLMTIQVGMKPFTPGTVIVLLAGILPVLTFVIERWVTRRYINPAMAAAGIALAATGAQAGAAAGSAPPPAQRPG
jgi:integral membrane protein